MKNGQLFTTYIKHIIP